MKKLFLSCSVFLLCGAGYAQSLNEGFEGGFTRPAGWSQEYVTGATDWQIAGYGAHSGSNRAGFASYVAGNITKFITPPMDISGVVNPVLKFWHTQEYYTPNQDTLRVYYKTSATGEWTLLQEYSENVASYTQRQLNLPNASADYYIAFEGASGGAGNIQLDDIVVMPAPTGPFIGENSSTFDLGDVYHNLPFGKFSKTYTIRNTGIADLIVSSIASSTNSRITVSGLPVTISAGSQEDITVELDADGLPVGFFEGDLVLESNDPENPEFTINVKAASKTAAISSYIYENFESGNMPADWTCINSLGWCRFATYDAFTGGIDGSRCISVNLGTPGASDAQETVKTGYIAMGATPVFSFNYKALMRVGFDYIGAAPAGNFMLTAQISKDNGTTWANLPLTPNTHNGTTDYALVSSDVSAYANEICMIRITVQTIGNPAGMDMVKAHLDNITIGTETVNELAAVSVTGSATPAVYTPENYTVQVKNFGSATQTNYTVKLMKKGDTDVEIASLPGVSIEKDSVKDFVFEWVPDAEGSAMIYGEVVLAEDEFALNNKTGNFSVTVQPGAYKNITVGTGTDKYYFLPYNTYYAQSLTQTLYYPHELKTNGGVINSLTYHAEIHQGVVNLEDIGIQVWMGETDMENLKDGWVHPDSLTLVYDGTMDFPVGAYDVTVNLDNPYEYKGRNLVVYSFKKKISDDGYGNINDGFTSTTYPNSGRSRGNFLVDQGDFDPTKPDSIEIVQAFDFIPNTNFIFNFENTGSLKGLVDNGTDPLDEAKIQIVGTNLYALTDAEGNYEIPYLVPDDYRIAVSRHGYFSDTLDITVTADNATTQDATLEDIPTYTVSGKVTGSNAPDGLENATVTLSGYHNYSTTTDASGDYTIENVYQNNTYVIEVKLALYNAYDSTVVVLEADTNHNLMLTETPYPVYSAAVQEAENKEEAVVSWEAPVAAEDLSYILDDGTAESGEGINPNASVYLGNQFTAEGENESILKSVDIYGFENNGASTTRKVTVEVFNSAYESLGSSESFLMPANEWINVPLGNITCSGTFYVMIKWPAVDGKTHYLGSDDNGPHARDILSMYYDGTNWGSFRTAAAGKHCVFMIRPNANILDESVTPTPSEYTVYRLTPEQPQNQWTALATTEDESYTDTAWISLANGEYKYAVTVTYTGENNVSKPILTATILKAVSGIVNLEDAENFSVYPNPVVDVLNIETTQTITEIAVIGQNGKVVKTQTRNTASVDFSNLPAGYYVVRFRTATGLGAVKVVK